jgi:hypothetical protein
MIQQEIYKRKIKMTAGYYDITIEQGATWSMPVRKTENLQTLTSLTLTGSTVTATLTSHDYSTGDSIFIEGANQAAYNGVQDITVTTDNAFTYTISPTVTPTTPATGTITAGKIYDLTGYTARMQVRKSKNSTDTEIELTTENGRITIDGANGLITCNLAASATTLLDFSKGFYDLEIVTGSTVERLLEGRVTLSKEVTK